MMGGGGGGGDDDDDDDDDGWSCWFQISHFFPVSSVGAL